MASVRYEFDEFNRLVILDPQDAAQPRRVVEGRVGVDPKNRLVYRAATLAPDAEPQARDPEAKGRGTRFRKAEYVFDGTWRLTDEHQLALALRDQQERDQEELFLRGSLLEAKGHALSAVLVRRGTDDKAASQRIALAGRWQADAQNRLTFLVEKGQGQADALVFDGAWEVDERAQLRYEYRQRRSGRGAATHALRLAGAWDLSEASQLVYRLEADTRSAFAFQASLQSRSLNARDGKLAYQLGIRLSDGRTVARQVVFFGAWKLNRDLSVAFEFPVSGGRRQAVKFQGTCTFKDRNTLTVALSNPRGEPLALSVTFSRKWLGDAEWFVRLQRHEQATELLGGLRIKF